MTADDSRDDPPKSDPDGAGSEDGTPPEPPLDVEAAWRLIVENYGERPQMGPDAGTVAPVTPAPSDPARPSAGGAGRNLFDRSYLDALDSARTDPAPHVDPVDDEPAAAPTEGRGRHDDEHFVPPEPPPIPRGTPARRLAWCGLFLPPVMMLAAVVFGWTYPSWASLGLVAAFVGGFVFLVATMPRDGGDGWGDGAVV